MDVIDAQVLIIENVDWILPKKRGEVAISSYEFISMSFQIVLLIKFKSQSTSSLAFFKIEQQNFTLIWIWILFPWTAAILYKIAGVDFGLYGQSLLDLSPVVIIKVVLLDQVDSSPVNGLSSKRIDFVFDLSEPEPPHWCQNTAYQIELLTLHFKLLAQLLVNRALEVLSRNY